MGDPQDEAFQRLAPLIPPPAPDFPTTLQRGRNRRLQNQGRPRQKRAFPASHMARTRFFRDASGRAGTTHRKNGGDPVQTRLSSRFRPCRPADNAFCPAPAERPEGHAAILGEAPSCQRSRQDMPALQTSRYSVCRHRPERHPAKPVDLKDMRVSPCRDSAASVPHNGVQNR